MISLFFKRMRNRKGPTMITVIALISMFTLVFVGLTQSKTAQITVQDTIEKYGRGSYDILVRPSSSRTGIEQKLGIVEENYIGDSKGGISIAEWEEIKNDPDIEVAAPVASLGYFRGKQASIELPILDKPALFTYQFLTSDGKNTYPVGKENSIMFFEETGPGMIQYLKNSYFGSSYSSIMSIFMPENYNLLIAIDPESERKLTGIDFSELNKQIVDDVVLNTMVQNYGNAPVIKILQNADLTIPLYLSLKVDTLNVNINEYRSLLGLSEQDWISSVTDEEKKLEAFAKLKQEKPVQTDTYKIDLSSYQKPFDGTALLLNSDFQPILGERDMFDLDTSTYYVASKINYQDIEMNPTVKIINEGNPPSYKNIEQKGVSIKLSSDIPFLIYQIGTFSPLEQQKNLLAGSPLGIYGDSKATLEDGTTLSPTTMPGSFISSPANGVTTIENAELIKGEFPIDAIRIKVSHISKYNKAAQEKIENVASRLLKEGYEVDIVAGSSLKEMTLQVEGIGQVNEYWTTLGVAQKQTTTWNMMTLITSIILITFALLWLFNRLTFEKYLLQQENVTLHLLGWASNKIFIRNYFEQFLLMTFAGIISVCLINIFLPGNFLNPIVFLLWVTSISLSFIILLKKDKKNNRTEAYKKLPAILHYKHFIIPCMLILSLSVILVAIQVAAFADSYYSSIDTTLGKFIGDQTFLFQISVILFVLLLSITSFSEVISSLFRERKHEFIVFHAIGWTKKKIIRRLFQESLIWFSISCLVGTFISCFILTILGIHLLWIFIGVLSSTVIMGIVFTTILLSKRSLLSLHTAA